MAAQNKNQRVQDVRKEKKRGAGRPPLTPHQKLIRAAHRQYLKKEQAKTVADVEKVLNNLGQNDILPGKKLSLTEKAVREAANFERALSNLRRFEIAEGLPEADYINIDDPSVDALGKQNVGRPPRTELDELDHKLYRLERYRLKAIETHAKEQVNIGRPRKSLDEILNRVDTEVFVIKETMKRLESNLSTIEYAKRELKKLRTQIRDLRKELKASQTNNDGREFVLRREIAALNTRVREDAKRIKMLEKHEADQASGEPTFADKIQQQIDAGLLTRTEVKYYELQRDAAIEEQLKREEQARKIAAEIEKTRQSLDDVDF